MQMTPFAQPGSHFLRATPYILGLCVLASDWSILISKTGSSVVTAEIWAPLSWQTEDVFSVGPLSQRGGVGLVTGSAPGARDIGAGTQESSRIPGRGLTVFRPLCAPFRFSNPKHRGREVGDRSLSAEAGQSVCCKEPSGPEAVSAS